MRVQSWTGLSLGPIQKSLEGKGASADSSCEQTGDVLGRQGALPVRKRSSCLRHGNYKEKGPAKKNLCLGPEGTFRTVSYLEVSRKFLGLLEFSSREGEYYTHSVHLKQQ